MDTTIGYLELVHEDLLDAAARTIRGVRPGRVPRFPGRTVAAAAAVVTLLAAGGVGWWVTRDSYGARPASGSTGAAGPAAKRAVGSGNQEQRALLGYDDALIGEVASPRPDQTQSTNIPGGTSRVIRTAQLGLVIPRDAFEERFSEAVDVAETNGGFVATSSTRERSGHMAIRVPADRFNETLASLRDLGTVEVQTVRGKDVTADYVDLHARLRIARSRREVLLGLMNDATSIEQSIRVQNALDETQLRIEELQGQLRLLDDRTSLATIELDLREQGIQPEAKVEKASIPNAFERAAAGFVGVIAGVVIGLGYVIPILILALAAWFVVSRVRKRRAA